MLRWLKTVVVSDEEKASGEASGRDREDGAQPCRGSLLTCRNQSDGIKTGVYGQPGMSLAGARFWPGGVRHGGDVSLVCCFCTERGRHAPTRPVTGCGW